MERLTMKTPDGYMLLDPIDIVDNKYSKINFDKVTSKLGYYEDLAEQGRLVELPCPIGTTIYAVVSECEGDYYECDHSCDTCNYRHIYVVEEKFNPEYLDEIGKWIFLTKEEAEQALKQIGE